MTLRCECSWCGTVLREGDAPTPVSHGICPSCHTQVLAETQEAVMTPRRQEVPLRAALVADVRTRAMAWHLQAGQHASESDARLCRVRAAVLDQLAHDLEDARQDDAPDWLAACQLGLRHLRHSPACAETIHCGTWVCSCGMAEAHRRIEAAIMRAEGR